MSRKETGITPTGFFDDVAFSAASMASRVSTITHMITPLVETELRAVNESA